MILAWKEALVTPIYKKGDRTVVSNYRPISLTFPIAKTMESIIRDRIQEHMTTNNLINMVLVLENPVLLSYSLQLIPGQDLLRRTMQLMLYISILPRLLIRFLTNVCLLSWSPMAFLETS